jgi:hypothetical protein
MFTGLVTGVTGKTPPGPPLTINSSDWAHNGPSYSEPVRGPPTPTEPIRSWHFFSPLWQWNPHALIPRFIYFHKFSSRPGENKSTPCCSTTSPHHPASNQIKVNQGKSNHKFFLTCPSPILHRLRLQSYKCNFVTGKTGVRRKRSRGTGESGSEAAELIETSLPFYRSSITPPACSNPLEPNRGN